MRGEEDAEPIPRAKKFPPPCEIQLKVPVKPNWVINFIASKGKQQVYHLVEKGTSLRWEGGGELPYRCIADGSLLGCSGIPQSENIFMQVKML